jgi:3-deoxy-D-manno-octulosonate 8-phosphate phosphatase (KDO 8-P phosphatase)
MIKFSNIKVLVLDVDGTLTDGIYQISEQGKVTKSFYTKDFYAIQKIMSVTRFVLIVTQSHDVVIKSQIQRIAGHSKIWETMLNYESLKIFTGIDDKEKCITSELLDRQLGWENVAYMGDAENDLPPMKKSLFTGCPADAIEEVRENSNYISDFPGGRGAVYDFCMHIYKENDKENR